MPSGRGRSSGMGDWVQALGEQIGTQLGQIIAQSVQRTLEKSIDARDIARRLGTAVANGKALRLAGRRGNAAAACREPACGNPVLAKGLCRSHYYRARYRAQKAGALPARRGRKARPPPAAEGTPV